MVKNFQDVDCSYAYAAGGEQAERAFNLGLAAILGEGVYNFGELVSTHQAYKETVQLQSFHKFVGSGTASHRHWENVLPWQFFNDTWNIICSQQSAELLHWLTTSYLSKKKFYLCLIMYLVFTCMPGESYCRWFRPLLLCSWEVCWVLINEPLLFFCTLFCCPHLPLPLLGWALH